MTTLTIAGDPAQAFYTFGSYARGTSYASPIVRMARVTLARADYYRLLAILTMP